MLYRNDKEIIEMLNVNELIKRTKVVCVFISFVNIISVNKVVFFLNGEFFYVVSDVGVDIVSVLDIFSGKFIVEKSFRIVISFVFVLGGVLFIIINYILELWNF